MRVVIYRVEEDQGEEEAGSSSGCECLIKIVPPDTRLKAADSYN